MFAYCVYHVTQAIFTYLQGILKNTPSAIFGCKKACCMAHLLAIQQAFMSSITRQKNIKDIKNLDALSRSGRPLVSFFVVVDDQCYFGVKSTVARFCLFF